MVAESLVIESVHPESDEEMFPKVVSAATSPNFSSSCTRIFPSSDFGLT